MFTTTTKAMKLMTAMAEHEGWEPLGISKTKGGSRAYRHHNPGNLRASPFASAIVDNFAVFNGDMVGWLAFHWDLMQKARGKTSTGLNKESSIADLLYKWAPPSDNNDTEAYITSVEAKSGLKRTETLGEVFNIK